MAEWYKSERFGFNYNAPRRVSPSVNHAVYIFWSRSKAKAVYVGKTNRSLQRRLSQHRDTTKNAILRAWIDCSESDLEVCYMTPKPKHAVQEIGHSDRKTKLLVSELEKLLINELDPIANNILYKT